MMKILLTGLSIFLFTTCSFNTAETILVITGGHEYDSVNFIRAFKSFDDLQYDHMVQPEANQVYSSDSIGKYDALVFYDLVQEIEEEQKAAFIDMLNEGKGIVFLHHSIASYQDWDEFLQVLGGRYHLESKVVNNDSVPASTYLDGQDVMVEIVDRDHPVTKGLEEFIIHEEVYNYVEVIPNVHPLMRTEHPESGEMLVWTNTYGKSRIVYIQFGHDNNAYSNPNFRKLLRQAIDWVCE